MTLFWTKKKKEARPIQYDRWHVWAWTWSVSHIKYDRLHDCLYKCESHRNTWKLKYKRNPSEREISIARSTQACEYGMFFLSSQFYFYFLVFLWSLSLFWSFSIFNLWILFSSWFEINGAFGKQTLFASKPCLTRMFVAIAIVCDILILD